MDDFKPEKKDRTTIFIDPLTLRRAKARGALEGLTLSEIVERSLATYGASLEQTVSASEVSQSIHGGQISLNDPNPNTQVSSEGNGKPSMNTRPSNIQSEQNQDQIVDLTK